MMREIAARLALGIEAVLVDDREFAIKVALELLSVGDAGARRAIVRVMAWVRDKLIGLRPPTPVYKLRYLRFRPWLQQSG